MTSRAPAAKSRKAEPVVQAPLRVESMVLENRTTAVQRSLEPTMRTLLQQMGDPQVLPATTAALADLTAAFMADLATESARVAAAAAAFSPDAPAGAATAAAVTSTIAGSSTTAAAAAGVGAGAGGSAGSGVALKHVRYVVHSHPEMSERLGGIALHKGGSERDRKDRDQ